MSRDDKEREPSASDKRWMPLPWSVERTCSQRQASSLTARGDSYMDLLFTWKPVMMQTSSLWLAIGTASITGKTTFSFFICYRIIFSDTRSALSTEWHRWEVEEGESQKLWAHRGMDVNGAAGKPLNLHAGLLPIMNFLHSFPHP